MVKSVSWRLLGVGVLALITWIYTRSFIQTTAITFLHHAVFIFVYYIHERVWNRIKMQGRKRKVCKSLFYELVLGQGILGIISLAVTGCLQQMTNITITYIWNKLWIYYVWESCWGKIKWAVNL